MPSLLLPALLLRMPGRRPVTTLLVLLLLLGSAGASLTASDLLPVARAADAWSAQAEPPAVIESIRLLPAAGEGPDAFPPQLLLTLSQGAFDPSLTWVNREKGGFRVLIEGENVRLDQNFQNDHLALTQAFAKVLPEIQAVQLFQYSDGGRPMIKITIDSGSKLQPQIRMNDGDRLSIGLVAESGFPASAPGRNPDTGLESLRLEKKPEKPVETKPIARAPVSEAPPARSASGLSALNPSRFIPFGSRSARSESSEETPAQPASRNVPKSASQEDPAKGSSRIGFKFETPLSASPASVRPSNAALYGAVTAANADPLLKQAWSAYREGRYEAARQSLGKLLTKNPQHPQGQLLQVWIGLAEGQRSEAMGQLKTLVAQTPAYLPAWLDWIALNLADGAFDASEASVRKGLSLWPDHPDLHYSAGLLQEVQGRPEQAKASYMKALSISPLHPVYHYRLAMLELKTQQPMAARQELDQVLWVDPDSREALKLQGFLAQKAGEPDAAMRFYRQAVQPDTLISYAVLLRKQNEPAQAQALLAAAEALAPDNPDIQFNLGMIYVEAQESEAATRTLRRFLTLTTRNGSGRPDARVARVESMLRSLGSVD